jgi:hypothetical protein
MLEVALTIDDDVTGLEVSVNGIRRCLVKAYHGAGERNTTGRGSGGHRRSA